MAIRLLGIGTAVPEHFVEQQDAAEICQTLCTPSVPQAMWLRHLFKKSEVSRRHSVVLQSSTNGTSASQSFYIPATSELDRGPSTGERLKFYEHGAIELAEKSSRRALERSRIAAEEVTHLVTVSCSGFSAPGFDLELIQKLPMRRSVARTHVGFMGCHGALNGLRVAQAFAAQSTRNRVLLCAVELCSLHYQYGWQPDRVVANALFADGAGAVVVSADPTAVGFAEIQWSLTDSHSLLIEDSRDAMGWHIGDHGFEMTLAPSVPSAIESRLGDWLDSWLAEHQLSRQDITHWAVHPGGPKILEAAQVSLGIAPEAIGASRKILSEYGNMSSPTVFFVLDSLPAPKPNDHCIMLGFGPGLVFEAVLLKAVDSTRLAVPALRG